MMRRLRVRHPRPAATPAYAGSLTSVAGLAERGTALLGALRDYFGLTRRRNREPITNRDELRGFLETRASFIAQTSLYGYLRTRAGMRYPELFDDDPFVASINIAKWQVWLACLADLAVYTAGMLLARSTGSPEECRHCVVQLVDEILAATGLPADAGDEFPATAERLRLRLAHCDLERIGDDESAFHESPTALVRWAPIVDELKAHDEGIVRNSVRFRWQEVRRELRLNLDAERVLGREG